MISLRHAIVLFMLNMQQKKFTLTQLVSHRLLSQKPNPSFVFLKNSIVTFSAESLDVPLSKPSDHLKRIYRYMCNFLSRRERAMGNSKYYVFWRKEVISQGINI